MKKYLSKIACLALAVIALCAMCMIPASASSVLSGLQAAEAELMSTGMSIVKTVVVPFGEFICLAVLVFLIIGMVGAHNKGEPYKNKIVGIVVVIAVMILLLAFGIWGPQLIGQGG